MTADFPQRMRRRGSCQHLRRLSTSFHAGHGERNILETPRFGPDWRLQIGLCSIGLNRRVRPCAMSYNSNLDSREGRSRSP
jgi:hypothetical protein